MAVRVFDSETWNRLGCPDLNSKMYILKDNKKVWGFVSEINYNYKGKIRLKIKPYKK